MASFSDPFGYSSGNLTGKTAEWLTWKTQTHSVDSNRLISNGGSECSNLYNGSFTGTQEAQILVSSGFAASNNYIGVGVRCAGADGTATGYVVTTDGTNYFISRYTAGSSTDLILSTSGTDTGTFGAPITTGTLKLRASGTTLTFYVDGVQIATATDATYSTGNGVVYSYVSTGNISLDDFLVQDVAAGSTQAPRSSAFMRMLMNS